MSDNAGAGTGLSTPGRPAGGSGGKAKERRPGRIKNLILFVRQVLAELRKVIWPTRRELLTYTSVVLVFVFFMVAVVSAYDFVFSQGVLQVFGD